MLVLFAVCPLAVQFRPMLEVDRESITPDGRIERLILEIELETEPVAIVRNRSIKIVDKKLRGDPGNLRGSTNCRCSHVIPRRVMVCVASGGQSQSTMLGEPGNLRVSKIS